MQEITNKKEEEINKEKEINHELKIMINNIIKKCEENEIPIFITYYTGQTGYVYRGLFPEELQDETLATQYHRFPKFLETVVDFNKEDFKPTISKNKK